MVAEWAKRVQDKMFEEMNPPCFGVDFARNEPSATVLYYRANTNLIIGR